MKNKKQRVDIWLNPKVIAKLESLIAIENVANLSQIIAKACDFYLGYVGTNDATEFLSKTLVGVVDGSIKQTENRNATNLFRLAVEMGIMARILAEGMDIPQSVMDNLRIQSINSVKKTNAKFQFEHAFDEELEV